MPRQLVPPLRCAIVALIASAWAGPAASQSQVESLNEQIQRSLERLDEIRREQQRLQNEMGELAAAVHDARAELDNLNEQARVQEALLREMDRHLAIRDQQVLATTADLLRTQDELIEKQVLFARVSVPIS